MKLTGAIIKPGFWGLNKGDFQDIGREAIRAAGLYWHEHFKRRHFQMEAFQLYNYRPRCAKTEAIKAKVHPDAEGRPLVFSGQSEQLAMAANNVIARATNFEQYHAKVTVSAPNLNFHANEMTRTTPEEMEEIGDEFARVFKSGMVDAAKANGVSAGRIALWEGQAA